MIRAPPLSPPTEVHVGLVRLVVAGVALFAVAGRALPVPLARVTFLVATILIAELGQLDVGARVANV